MLSRSIKLVLSLCHSVKKAYQRSIFSPLCSPTNYITILYYLTLFLSLFYFYYYPPKLWGIRRGVAFIPFRKR